MGFAAGNQSKFKCPGVHGPITSTGLPQSQPGHPRSGAGASSAQPAPLGALSAWAAWRAPTDPQRGLTWARVGTAGTLALWPLSCLLSWARPLCLKGCHVLQLPSCLNCPWSSSRQATSGQTQPLLPWCP